ncbi:MAG: hypothetical protein LBS05_05485 [Tannerellaceae bacterium]|jgi:hypothetical protein|nr:hypothetical protein [Tannerellaceae bacterium]
MKIKAFLLSSVLCAGLTLGSCCSEEEPMIVPSRTVLVYMAADNSLSSFADKNIKNMLIGAEGNNLNGGNLLVYHDPASEPPRLLRIIQGTNGAMEEQIIRTYEEHNSVSVEVMRNVLEDVFLNPAYKADSYGLLLWSHASAWLPSDIGNYLRSFGQDRTPKNSFMEIYDLQKALQGYTFDYIIFDVCYMSNVEVAYALRNYTDYILASPTEVLGPGMPYEHIVKYLFSGEPVQSALQKAGERFYTYYENQEANSSWPKSASTALVKTSDMDALAAICREILLGKYETFDLPVENIQRMEYLRDTDHALYDLGDFIRQQATSEQYARFMEALGKVVVYKNTTQEAFYSGYDGQGRYLTIDKDRFCGISAYVPQLQLTALNEWYKQLDWYKAVYE